VIQRPLPTSVTYNTTHLNLLIEKSVARNRLRHIHDFAIFGSLAGDIAAFCLGMHMAYLLRFEVFNLTTESYLRHIIFGAILFLMLAMRSRLYQQGNFLRLRRVYLSLTKTILLWGGAFLLVSLTFEISPEISRIYVILSAICCLLSLMLWRCALWRLFQVEGMARKLRQRILMVGWNVEAEQLARTVVKDPAHPYEIIGCLPSAHNVYRVEPPSFVQKLGDYSTISDIVENGFVDVVIVCDLDPGTKEILALSELCEREMVQFKIIPTYFQILLSGLYLETISGVPVLGIERLPAMTIPGRILKRGVDIIGSIVGLIATFPIILIAGWLVYRESPGPIIYSQVRTGRRGTPFRIYKIRSMRLDAEKGGVGWSKQHDPRRLRIGAILRKWNIDELPQFWNVLKGEMSLVGPRPERPELIDKYKDEIQFYNARHGIKPGITGWAQIHGLRGDTDLHERVRYDLYYIENWNLLMDFYIIAMTLLRNRNAQ
jgi:exopolysaccharide biosynthesis polyprenyl glycosylphosphotransferase